MSGRRTRNGIMACLMLLWLATSASAELVGLWRFDDATNLGKATIGNDLVLKNEKGTISSVDGIGAGDKAAAVGPGDSFSLTHDIDPNGGSNDYVNQYTILYDLNTRTNGWRSLLQTSAGPNDNDGDYWISPSGNLGVGLIGYSSGSVEENTWYRIVFSANIGGDLNPDMEGDQSFMATVIDINDDVVFTHFHGSQGLNGRHSFYSTPNLNIVHFFADNDGEDGEIYVTQLAMFDGFMTQSQAEALGGPGSVVPEPSSFVLFTSSLLLVGGLFRLRRRSR